MKKRKIIAFSLFGKGDLYNKGAVANVREAAVVYPDWKCRFYVSPTAPAVPALKKLGAEVIVRTGARGWSPLFWRLEAASDPTVSWVIFRDCDSRVNTKEAAAVKAWMESGKVAHLMKDYPPPHATETILAGMWGIRGGFIPNMRDMILDWFKKADLTNKYTDQDFLRAKVWPLIKHNVISHGVASAAGRAEPWPPHEPMKYGEYVGQPIQPD